MELAAVYHEMPPQPNNFRNDEILACVAHRLRAHHGIKAPADILIYDETRSKFEQQKQNPSDIVDEEKRQYYKSLSAI